MKRKFTFISICGGISMGGESLKQLGGIEIACIDAGELQEYVYNLCHPRGLYFRIDIRKLTLKVLNAFLISKGRKPIKKGELNCILFSTPCTYASGLNYYRTPHHEINQLTSVEIPRILEEFAPKDGFIAENIPDLVTDAVMRPALNRLKRTLKAANKYDFDYAILDSADYQCWTSRPRWIMLGKAKSKPGTITFPKPTTKQYSDFYLNKLIPTALAYTPGLYRDKVFDVDSDMLIGKPDKWLSADRILGTVTASGGEGILDSDFDDERGLTVIELKKIFGIPHFNFDGVKDSDVHFLVGNGIVVPFLKIVANHFLTQFLTK